MTPSELSLLDPEERRLWELEQKATPNISFDGGSLLVGQYRFILRADGVGWKANDFAFFEAARNLVKPLLSKVVRLRQDFNNTAHLYAALLRDSAGLYYCSECKTQVKTAWRCAACEGICCSKICLTKHLDKGFQLCMVKQLAAAESRISDLTKELEQWKKATKTPANCPEWKCFHCGFGTSDPKEAAAHFGDRDDAEEFKPLCKWWQRMDDGERAETLQDTIQRLNDEQDAVSTLTLEKDSALQLRDRYKERVGELEARLRWALGHLPKFVTMTDPPERVAELPTADELLNRLITGLEPNGYPLWFNRAVHECEDCDSEDLCMAHAEMTGRNWTGCEAEISKFRAALACVQEGRR